MNQEYNILIGNTEESDKELFFGPLSADNPNDQFITMPSTAMLSHILVQIGLFPSMGAAKGNRWHKPVLEGFTDFKVGKLKTRICVLKVLNSENNNAIQLV